MGTTGVPIAAAETVAATVAVTEEEMAAAAPTSMRAYTEFSPPVLATTVVVRKSVCTPTPKHPAWRLVLAIAAGSAAAITIQFTEMLLNVL